MEKEQIYNANLRLIYQCFIRFIENSHITDINDTLFNMNIFKNLKKESKKDRMREILYIISKIANHHHRSPDFFNKIEYLLKFFQNDIKQTLSNSQLLKIFSDNQRILLFLFNDQFLEKDKETMNFLYKKYRHYFEYELLISIADLPIDQIDSISKSYEEFNLKRPIGENDSYICELIREDSIQKFVKFVNQSNIQLSQTIEPSIFETNQFLIENPNTTLIEYAAFFGSIKIFNYLRSKDVQLLTPSLFLYAIHSNKAEMIHLLEETFIDRNYQVIVNESIKCHHNNLFDYFRNSYESNDDPIELYKTGIEYHNYDCFSSISDLFNQKSLNANTLITKIDFLCSNLKACRFSISKILFNEFFKKDKFDVNIAFKIFEETAQYLNTEIFEVLFSKFSFKTNLNKIWTSDKDKSTKCTLLILAVENENVEIVEYLLKKPKINVKTNSKSESIEKSLLSIAVIKENIQIVKLLLSNPNIDVNSKYLEERYHEISTEKGVLFIAIEKRNIEIIQLLLSHPSIDINMISKIDRIDYTPLTYAIKIGNKEIVNLLLSHPNIDVNMKFYPIYDENEESALLIAVEQRKKEIVELLISHPKIDINMKHFYYGEITALSFAVKKNLIDIVKLLLSNKNIDVNLTVIRKIGKSKERSALTIAVKNRFVECVKLLVMHPKIDINKRLNYYKLPNNILYKEKVPLFMAVKKGFIEIVEILLSNKNIDVNIKINNQNEGEQTPLSIAVINRNFDVIKLLLSTSNTININEKLYDDKRNMRTPMSLAIADNNKEIIMLLLKYQAKISGNKV